MEEPPNPCGVGERLIPKGEEGLLTEGGVKCLLVKTGSLTMSPTLTRKEAWLRGMEEDKAQSEESGDHDELSLKHIHTLVSEVVSSLDALKATRNRLIER